MQFRIHVYAKEHVTYLGMLKICKTDAILDENVGTLLYV